MNKNKHDISISITSGNGVNLTSDQRPQSPHAQRDMIKQLHPHVHGKPRGWGDEELVTVGRDVPFAKGGHKFGA